MRIVYSSVMVDDQARALRFYTGMLGFVKKTDIDMGGPRWLTVESPDGVSGVELLLEPMGFTPARTYQAALYAAGIPLTAFITADIDTEYARLKERGVIFRGVPRRAGTVRMALFEDTCGNLISLVQPD